jgi:hypothetical protein
VIPIPNTKAFFVFTDSTMVAAALQTRNNSEIKFIYYINYMTLSNSTIFARMNINAPKVSKY